jgi:DNA-binding NtrC family response regulator
MMAQVLESLGHSVIEAADGEQAIAIYREKADGIDLTVLDWMMPGVDGREVLQVIQAHDPESKVLMTSGFSRDYVRSQVRMGAWAFLQKPFSAEQFKESVGKVLGLKAK